MFPIDEIVERRIREATERGEFDGLAGAGKPLRLEDNSFVPEELRAAYRILKNAGYIPEEVRLRREISEIEALLNMIDEPLARDRTMRKLRLLETRLGVTDRATPLTRDIEYREKIVAALEHAQAVKPRNGG